jgi:hypothetical protein
MDYLSFLIGAYITGAAGMFVLAYMGPVHEWYYNSDRISERLITTFLWVLVTVFWFPVATFLLLVFTWDWLSSNW